MARASRNHVSRMAEPILFFPVSVRTQGSLLAFGRAYGPKGVWGWKWDHTGVSGLFARKNV